MSRAQHILAVIVGLITGVLLMESYGAMVDAARAGGRAIPELWPLGTEALALAMEVSVLEAKRLGHRAVVIGRLKSRSWETPEGDKRSVVEVEADEVAPSLRWAIAKPERASANGAKGKGGQFNDEPDF